MKNYLLLLLLSLCCYHSKAQDVSKKYLENKTVTYDEAIGYYKMLAAKNSKCKLIECGGTDIGKPLQLFVITNDGDFNPASIRNKNKRIILINNGIHPGEPCGIDACLGLSNDLMTKKDFQQLLEHVVVCIIPVYNIDGALNRGSFSRANQNGPEEYGFRANARNLDLNRDFIKCDAENTKSFIKIFRTWQPEVFIDTHISDGADYQYTMTFIPTQQNKLHPLLAEYMNKELIPTIKTEMKNKQFEMTPYIETMKQIPDDGISGFLETPRFASGYTTLFNTIGFITETHMLKPYPQQVAATYTFLHTIIQAVNKDYQKIKAVKKAADDDCAKTKLIFDLQWKLDTTKFDMINFKGYQADYKTSVVTGLERLYYDETKPFEKQIKYYNEYQGDVQAMKPYCYIIPQCWHEVIERMRLNKIEMHQLLKDTALKVQSYYISDYTSTKKPYEGHYLHSDVNINTEDQKLQFRKGDYIIVCDQSSNRYIVETLEPQGVDSWFAWNFFDASMQQKEWFSDYVFEEKAADVLNGNPALRDSLTDYVIEKNLQQDHWAQLAWIYQHSPYYEKSAMRYPVFRINEKMQLPYSKIIN